MYIVYISLWVQYCYLLWCLLILTVILNDSLGRLKYIHPSQLWSWSFHSLTITFTDSSDFFLWGRDNNKTWINWIRGRNTGEGSNRASKRIFFFHIFTPLQKVRLIRLGTKWNNFLGNFMSVIGNSSEERKCQ